MTLVNGYFNKAASIPDLVIIKICLHWESCAIDSMCSSRVWNLHNNDLFHLVWESIGLADHINLNGVCLLWPWIESYLSRDLFCFSVYIHYMYRYFKEMHCIDMDVDGSFIFLNLFFILIFLMLMFKLNGTKSNGTRYIIVKWSINS